MKKMILMLVLLYCATTAFAESINRKLDDCNISINCEAGDKGLCQFISTNEKTKKTFRSKILVLDIRRIGMSDRGNHLIKITKSFGTNNNYSSFFDCEKEILTKIDLYNVATVDSHYKLLTFDKTETDLAILPIFHDDDEAVLVRRDFLSCPSCAIDQDATHFKSKNELFLVYSERKGEGEISDKSESIFFNFKNF